MVPSLRSLTPDDAAAFHALCTHPEAARDLVGHLPTQPLPMFRKRIEGLNPQLGVLIGAEVNGRLVGVAGFDGMAMPRRRHAGQAWVAVDPASRRRGVGRALLAAVLDTATGWYHLDRLELIIPAGADAALALAAKLGFEREVCSRQAVWREGVPSDVLHLAWVRPGLVAEPGHAEPLPSRPVDRWEVRIRVARPDDARAITAMVDTRSVLGGTLQVPYTPESLWRHRLETNDPALHQLVVAEHEGRVVGMSGLHGTGMLRAAGVWGLGMTVHPDAQGRGVGTALMRHVLAVADGCLGARRVELDVYTDNERGIALYERHGFVREGIKRCDAWRDGAYVDSLVMARLR